MKKLSYILLIAVALVIGACEGSTGPMGPPGEDGYNFEGATFEFTGDFIAPGYQLVFNFLDNDYDPLESDVILAYILWKNEDGLDFWRPLPQTIYFDSGAILQYNYDFTGDFNNKRIVDMSVFLGGDVDFSTLPADFITDQTFRIVAVPSKVLNLKNVDINNINSILDSPNIKLKSLGTIQPGTAVDTNIKTK